MTPETEICGQIYKWNTSVYEFYEWSDVTLRLLHKLPEQTDILECLGLYSNHKKKQSTLFNNYYPWGFTPTTKKKSTLFNNYYPLQSSLILYTMIL